MCPKAGRLNIIQTDHNNDGCLDNLVLRGGWETALRKSLLRNNCNGAFTDVTVEGLAEPTTTHDGFLDLYVGNENGPNQLFLNNGNGTLKDISQSPGTELSVFAKAVGAADYDNDGYACSYRTTAVIARCFTDVTPHGVAEAQHRHAQTRRSETTLFHFRLLPSATRGSTS